MSDIPVQSVRKAFDLFSLLAFEDINREGISVTTLARKLDLHLNTTHNLLKSMCATGFVAQTADARYVLGPKALQLGKINQLLNKATADRIRPIIETLGSSLNETVLLVTLINGKRVPLVIFDPVQPIKVDFTAIPDRSIYDVPTGRILVSYTNPQERAMIIDEWGMPGGYWLGIETLDQLHEACVGICKQSYSEIVGANDLYAVACPVLDKKGNLLGALGCYAPMFRCAKNQRDEITQKLLQTAAILGNELSIQV